MTSPAVGFPDDWCVITANFGHYDDVQPVPPKAAAIDWVYVTDDSRVARTARRRGWRVVEVPGRADSTFLRSRHCKARPDLYTDRGHSIYLDARYVVRSVAVLRRLAEVLQGGAWMAAYPHPARRTLSQEGAECLRLGLGGDLVASQLAHYDLEAIGRGTPLLCGGVLVRRHCEDQVRFGELWLSELRRWPTRDQLSLPAVLEDLGASPALIPGSVYRTPGLWPTPHRKRRPDDPLGRHLTQRLVGWVLRTAAVIRSSLWR